MWWCCGKNDDDTGGGIDLSTDWFKYCGNDELVDSRDKGIDCSNEDIDGAIWKH